jgi:hypothetical protein
MFITTVDNNLLFFEDTETTGKMEFARKEKLAFPEFHDGTPAGSKSMN